jgi:hypothetical protein
MPSAEPLAPVMFPAKRLEVIVAPSKASFLILLFCANRTKLSSEATANTPPP